MSDDSTTPGPLEAWVREWIDSNPDGFNTMAPLFDAAREQDARLAALEADNARLREAYIEAAHALHDNHHVGRGAEDFTDCPEGSCIARCRIAGITEALAHDAAEGELL